MPRIHLIIFAATLALLGCGSSSTPSGGSTGSTTAGAGSSGTPGSSGSSGVTSSGSGSTSSGSSSSGAGASGSSGSGSSSGSSGGAVYAGTVTGLSAGAAELRSSSFRLQASLSDGTRPLMRSQNHQLQLGAVGPTSP